MARKKKFDFVTAVCLIIALIGLLYCYFDNSSINEFAQKPAYNNVKKSNLKEGDYVKMYCKGYIEYMLPDRTRVDCLTDEYAIEYDWAKKWAESIGQALYYSKMTGKKPAVAIIIKNPYERLYRERIKKADSDIKIFEIKAENYSE